MKKERIKVIGLGQNFHDILPLYWKIIENAEILVGGKRQLEFVSHLKAEKIPITSPIEEVLDKLRQRLGENIVVLSDGDPLIFGIGKTLIKEFGADLVEIYPNVSTVQMAGAKIGLGVTDIHIVSLHGRDNFYKLLNAVTWHDVVGVYTDNVYNPQSIAKELLDIGVNEFKMYVFENLGQKNEKIGEYSLSDAAKSEFSPLNFVILKRGTKREIEPYVGMDDDLFFKENNQITKKEIRVISIGNLELKEDSFLVDIGAGSGSVSIEAATIAKKGRIIAIEKMKNRAELIEKNKKRFGIYSVEVINDRAEDVISSYSYLDRVFIGGGLCKDPDLFFLCYDKLRQGGKIVANIVVLKTLINLMTLCKKKGIFFEITQVMVNRGSQIGEDLRLSPINPVFILSIKK